MVAEHRRSRAIASVASFQRDVRIDLGILNISDDGSVVNYVEKPTLQHAVSMGIYVFEPAILNYIPKGERLDLPALILRLISDRQRVNAYQHDGYWLDIGRHDDYQEATRVFESNRAKFLPSVSAIPVRR
jgi:NDP-sugar pyrophosphorylase family protein